MPQVSGTVPARHSLTRLQLSVSEAETYLSITWFRVRLLPAPRGDTAGRDRSLRRAGCRRARTRCGGAAQKVYLRGKSGARDRARRSAGDAAAPRNPGAGRAASYVLL